MVGTIKNTCFICLYPQKFRFCGDLDCPDWVLAEISILSKLVSSKVKDKLSIKSYSLTKVELNMSTCLLALGHSRCA